MPQQAKKTLVLSIYFVLAVSVLLVFWQVGNFDFLSYDDGVYVSENSRVLNGLTADNVVWAFTTGFAAFWHPLTWLSLMLDCQLFGSAPAGFHLTNLFFHLVNTLLLFAILRKTTGSLWSSAFVAALFAIHPMHVESVVWISERKDVLSTFFWFLAMWAYIRYAKKPGVLSYLLVLLIFALGLMTKPMLVTLPFVFLLLDYWPFQRKISSRLLVEKVPFIILAIVSSVVAFLAQQGSRSISSFNALPLKFRIANALISYIKYMGKLFWPARLSPFYPHPVENVSVLYAVISAGVLLTVTILVIRFAKNHRYLVTGWFWFLGTLIPVIGIIQVGSHAMADRYTYITLTGLFIIIAWGVPQFFSKWPQHKIILGSLMIISLTTLGICAHRQTSYWKNSLTLFSHANQVTQNNYLAHNNIGVAYAKLGCYQLAMESYKQAIKIKPDYAMAFYNRGIVYEKLNRLQQAMEVDKQAIKINPYYAEAHNNLAVTFGRLARWHDAIESCKQAVKIRPDYAEAHVNLGEAYLQIGDKNSALSEYNILKSLNSEFADNLLDKINQ